jgi:2-oxoglutarate dehydrogenase E1 component
MVFILNAAHRIFAQLYDQYLENPDSVEVGGVFQGFDFGMTTYNEKTQSANSKFCSY